MKKKYLSGVSFLMVSVASLAAQATQSGDHPPSMSQESHRVTDIGRTTMADLDLQRSGRNSVGSTPLSHEVAIRIYDRYLKSFTHEIPEEFEEDSFGSESN